MLLDALFLLCCKLSFFIACAKLIAECMSISGLRSSPFNIEATWSELTTVTPRERSKVSHSSDASSSSPRLASAMYTALKVENFTCLQDVHFIVNKLPIDSVFSNLVL